MAAPQARCTQKARGAKALLELTTHCFHQKYRGEGFESAIQTDRLKSVQVSVISSKEIFWR